MTDLQSLLSRVMDAEGPDRELARDVFEALTGECTHRNTHFTELENDERELECSDCGADTYGEESRWSNLTTSLDAALALVERVLPGWDWRVDSPDAAIEFRAEAWVLFEDADFRARAATPALALLAALLKAKATEEKQS